MSTYLQIYLHIWSFCLHTAYLPTYISIYTFTSTYLYHTFMHSTHICALYIYTAIYIYISNLYLNLYIIQYTHVSGTAHFNWLPGASWYRVVADVCGAALASCTAHFYWDARWKEREERQFGKSPFKLYGWQLKYADYTWLVYIYIHTVDAFLCWFSHSWWWMHCSYEQMDTDMSKYMN